MVIGAKLLETESNSLVGTGDYFLAEADESDGSFQYFNPEIVVLTGLDKDHFDYYKDFEDLKGQFFNFVKRIPFYGKLILYGDNKELFSFFKKGRPHLLSYGFEEHNDYVLKVKDARSYQVFYKSKTFG